MTDLRYPIGKFRMPDRVTDAQQREWIDTIAETPGRLREAVAGLSDAQLDTAYRPGGWTVRQVVHHVPDSHLNAYTRIKLALTEDAPTIKTYMEERWAELPEARTAPIDVSLSLLEALHRRWVLALRSSDPADFVRPFRHADWGLMRIEQALAQYAWHGRHHVAHVTALRAREGW
jgi:uncharacterized damage-inducible protein DinB